MIFNLTETSENEKLITRTVTKKNVALELGTSTNVQIDVNYEGYKPIGIVGINLTNGLNCAISWYYVGASGIANVGIKNPDTELSPDRNITVIVLYVKNE